MSRQLQTRTAARPALALATALAVFALAPGAGAERKTKYIGETDVEKLKKEAEKKKNSGWIPKLTLGASVAVNQSSNVVGQTDGTAFTVGLQLDGGLEYHRGPHEWRNTLKLNEAFTRTPAIDEFVKSNDVLALESIYLYQIKRVPWLGPYARLQLNTSVLQGVDVRAGPTDYKIDYLDGSSVTKRQNQLRISNPFQPLNLKQTLGVFARPVKSKRLNIEFRVGFTGSQTFAANQYAINDDAATPQVEVKELRTIYQAGPAASIDIKGALVGGRMTYFLGAEAMMPAINNKLDADDRGAAELTNVLIEAGLSLKIVKWASLDYKLRALREAQLLDKFQVQNTLLLTFSVSVFDGKPVSKKK